MDGLNAAAHAFSPCAPDGKENVDARTAKVSRLSGVARTWRASKGGMGEGQRACWPWRRWLFKGLGMPAPGQSIPVGQQLHGRRCEGYGMQACLLIPA